MDSEEVQAEDKYHWNHPLKTQLQKGLAQLWETPSISFDSLDGSCPEQGEADPETNNSTSNSQKIKNVPYTLNPIMQKSPLTFCSSLQYKYSKKQTPMDDRMKRYFKAVSILEYEHDHGSLIDNDFETSMVGESCWVPSEKKKLFLAIERCGKGNVKEIARRVGPTKTIVEVMEYIKLLQLVSKGIGKQPCKHLTAREMSPVFIAQEQHVAELIQDKLQVESYGKSLDYLNEPQQDLFEIWNMSSITRLFSGINDMTILTSSTINFHQLIKNFVSDIIIDLHTELLKTTDKTVTKKLMNYIIAKRERNLEPDRRLKHLNISAVLEKKYNRHHPFDYSSASYLAKKRVRENYKSKESSDSNSDSDTESIDFKADPEEKDSDDEDDEEYNDLNDKFPNFDENDLFSKEEHVQEDMYHKFVGESLKISSSPITETSIGLDSSEEDEDESDNEEEKEEEEEMQKLDAMHEKELTDYFNFYDENTILNSSTDEHGASKKRRLK